MLLPLERSLVKTDGEMNVQNFLCKHSGYYFKSKTLLTFTTINLHEERRSYLRTVTSEGLRGRRSVVLPLQSAAAFGMSCDLISLGHVTHQCKKKPPYSDCIFFSGCRFSMISFNFHRQKQMKSATDTKLVSRILISQVTMSAFVLLSDFCIN